MKSLIVGLAFLAAVLPGPTLADEDNWQIRPGIPIEGHPATPGHFGPCTGNFLFHASTATSATYFIGSAGHCADMVGEKVRIGVSPVAFGEVAYSFHNQDARQHDFALIRIYDEYVSRTNPAMCYWGGPTGILTDLPSQWEVRLQENIELRTYGQGGTNDPVLKPHSGRLLALSPSRYDSLITIDPGDSGRPVMTASGLAVGLDVGALLPVPETPDHAKGVTLVWELQAAEAALQVDLELLTAPLKAQPSHEASCGEGFAPWVRYPPNFCVNPILSQINAVCGSGHDPVPRPVVPESPPWEPLPGAP